MLGVAIYGLDKPLMETWMNYKSKNVKTSFNASLASGNLNHVTADLYYAFEVIRIFVSAVYLHPEFIALQTDSKWGSGLKAGSQGYANGVGLSISPWKVSSLGYCVLRNNYKEQRFMLDLRYKKNPLEVILSYSTKNITELVEEKIFPFALHWQEECAQICKLSVKLQILKELQLSYQLQGDIKNLRSYASVLRLTFKSKNDLLRVQFSRCSSCGNALYFLRPLTSSTYSIRRAPERETLYLDLVYSKNIGAMTLYILLRNEGMNVGFTIEN